MNYFNIFIIIFAIDVFILIAEVIVYYVYTESLLKEESVKLVKSKLQLLVTDSQFKNEIIKNYKQNETKYINKTKDFSLAYCITFIVGLFIFIGLYIWVVTKQFKIEINYKYCLIVISIVILFIILLEVSSIFLTLLEYSPNYMDLSIYINNTLKELLTKSINDEQYSNYLNKYDNYIMTTEYGIGT